MTNEQFDGILSLDMKKLTSEDRIKLLEARIERRAKQNKVYKAYAYRDTYITLDTSEVLLDDAIKALTENNEVDAETAERYGI